MPMTTTEEKIAENKERMEISLNMLKESIIKKDFITHEEMIFLNKENY